MADNVITITIKKYLVIITDGTPVGAGGIAFETDPVFTGSVAFNISQADVDLWNAGVTETDPIFQASVAAAISQADVDNWNANTTALATETAARIAGDALNDAAINAETLARQGDVANLQVAVAAETFARVAGDTALQGQITAEVAARIAGDGQVQANLDQEVTDRISGDSSLQSNIDSLTLEAVRAVNNRISGNINASGNTIDNLADAVDPQQPITKAQFDAAISSVGSNRGPIDCSLNPDYPASSVGDRWEVTVAGKIGGAFGIDVDVWDEIVCSADTPLGGDQVTVGANFYIVQGNLVDASESVSGFVKLASDAETQAGVNNTKAITSLKLSNWWTFIKTQAQTFAAKITFTLAPRFNSASASQYLKTDGSKDLTSVSAIPATDVTPDSTHRFATDTEKTLWNSAEPGITASGNVTDFWSGTKTFRNLATDVRAVVLTGLSLVTNAAITAADTILSALGKLQKQITDLTTTVSGKEPTITASGNVTDFWAGTKAFRNLATDVRAVVLTGLSLATNQAVAATDTILQAFGYLQKQITDLTTTVSGHTTTIATLALKATVTAYTGNATWNKPSGAKVVRVIVISGGGGGGSGRDGTAGTVRFGGGGGGAGGVSEQVFDASLLGSSEAVVVGTGGAGGAARTGSNVSGNTGNNGAISSFGNYIRSTQGLAGQGGTTAAGTAGAGGTGLKSSGGAGGAGGAAGGAGNQGGNANLGSCGGGGGGGVSSGDVASAGGLGGGSPTFYNASMGGGAGGTVGAGQNGSQGVKDDVAYLASGSGGGAASITGNAGSGGNGLQYGAGGGGGGAGLSGTGSSGAGGNGADGIVIVIVYF